ncbi:hypothetical protein [Promicromonospora sp. NPDC057488]|uniref:hypothetical protein n=1 Tax=Promicromonospora sp. NPDC057488 TaxID=3346147 RepID=UPI0036731AA3
MSTPKSTDLEAARRYVYDAARLLERHRLAVLFDGAPAARVLDALRPYRNDDGGWGHALEPDLRGPDSQVSGALSALGVLAELGTAADPEVASLARGTADWLAGVALPDGRAPHVLPTAAGYPAAPWMVPNDGGFLTYAIAGHLWELGLEHPWLDAATAWCWKQLDGEQPVDGYTVLFALNFLDAVPEPDRVATAVERLRPALREDGTISVSGGEDGEELRPLLLSQKPGAPSRALFTEQQIADELDLLEGQQLDDGGWDFDYAHWSPGQTVDARGLATLGALVTLRTHGRL